MEHVLPTLFRSLSRDLIENARLTEQERRTLTRDLSRDSEYVRRRFSAEGPSFFTKALPNFGKHITACVEAGAYTPPCGFKHGGGNAPRFFRGWIARLFQLGTGSVRDDACPIAMRAVRQLSLFASKAKALPDPELCRKAYKEYVEDDASIDQESLWSRSISTFGYHAGVESQHFTVDRYYNSLGTIGRLFLQTGRAVGYELDRRYGDNYTAIEGFRLEPKHGPGAVAERLDDDGKWQFTANHRVERLSTSFDTFWVSDPEDVDGCACDSVPVPQPDTPSRLIAVPKTALTPRLIAAEPCLNQFWQQALMGFLKASFDESWLGLSIDISDQTKSQRRAILGSTDRSLGTIDLSKASDSVTLDHLGALFPGDSPLLHALLCCRTETIEVPDHGVIRLRKFASMGSAVCFPIESAVFLAAVAASIIRQLEVPFTSKRLQEVCREVTVYGDDIIAPSRFILGIMQDLRTLGFIPNPNKSFYKSDFRESCGVEVFKGSAVKPIYLRQDLWSRKTLTDEDIVALISMSRQCYEVGLFRTAEITLNLVRCQVGEIPYSEDPVPYLSHNIPWKKAPVKQRFNPKLQRIETLGLVPTASKEPTTLDGYARLLRYFVKSNSQREPDFMNPADTDWTKKPTRGFTLRKKYA